MPTTATGRAPEPLDTRVAVLCDRVLDATVVLLATWTVVYHASLLLDVGSTPALAVEALLLAALWAFAALWASRGAGGSRLVGRPAPTRQVSPRPPGSALVVATVVAALAGATAMALDLPWATVWVPWLAAGAFGTAVAALRTAGTDAMDDPRPAGDKEGGWFALAAALLLAGFATVTLRPNPDDLFYVNLSQWVAETGEFPLRDTIFSDLAYPMTNWPPLASYDALTGALAHLVDVRAGDVVYVVVPPLATALAVLALWRLLRTWRVPHVPVALAAALVFLLLDGTASYGTPGNLFLTRLWQGKVILLCVVVPVLLTYALRYAERPTARRALWLGVGGGAAVACSTTALFLLPVVALGAAAPLLARHEWRRAVVGFLAVAAYPLVAAAATLVVGGRSADDFAGRRQYRFDPEWFGHEVFLTGVLALVAVAAVLLGSLLVPHPAAALTTAVLVTCTGVVLVPGVTELGYDLVGLGPTLWRITWSCTVAALVGVLAATLWARAPSTRVRWSGAVIALAVLAVTGAPIWRSDTSTGLAAPPHWQRGDDSRATAAWVIREARDGGRVLAPDGLAITVTVTTTDVKTVAPRDYYLDQLSDEPGFRYAERVRLVDFANNVPGRSVSVVDSLRALDVAVACVYREDLRGRVLLEASGYRVRHVGETYVCLTPGADS